MNAGIDTAMPKPKSQSPFAFVRQLLGKTELNATPVLKVEQRKADEEVLDRTASLNLSIAETLAPLAIATQDPALINVVLGASREARACAEARKEVTGGGLAGGTQTGQPVTVRIEHSGEYVSDDFHDYKVPSSNDPHVSVQAGPSKSEQ